MTGRPRFRVIAVTRYTGMGKNFYVPAVQDAEKGTEFICRSMLEAELKAKKMNANLPKEL